MLGGQGLCARLTEIRIWASARIQEDIDGGKSFYLDLAEKKNTMKVSIECVEGMLCR